MFPYQWVKEWMEKHPEWEPLVEQLRTFGDPVDIIATTAGEIFGYGPEDWGDGAMVEVLRELLELVREVMV